MADVTISGYENEDIVRPFVVQTGDADSPVPFDLTDYELESDIVDTKTGASILRLTTNEADNRIVIVDAQSGMFTMRIGHGLIPYDAKLRRRFDVLAKNTTDGSFRWLFGGPVNILDGLTTPL